jgi:hypothetical protein
MRTRPWVVACLLLAVVFSAHAQTRVALVIGNSTYGGTVWSDLAGGPLLDARRIRSVLHDELKFQIVYREDADLKEMNKALDEFRAQLRDSPGALALVYFSGHGGQAPAPGDGSVLENYLIPAGTDLKDESDAQYLAVGQGRIEALIRGAGASAGVLIFDACREHLALAGPRAGGTRGLLVEAGTNILVLYAAASGKFAYNPPRGSVSEFTSALAEEIVRPGPLGEMAPRIRRRVIEKTKARERGPQEPEQLNKLNESIELVALIPPSPPRPQYDPRAAELSLWQGAQKVGTADAYREYLSHYPQGQYSGLANLQIAALTRAGGNGTGVTRPPASSAENVAQAPVQDCDRLAQPPNMGQRYPVSGVAFEKIDDKAALEACERALREFPGDGRFKAYLGRVLQHMNRVVQAAALFREAAAQGNSVGQTELGTLCRDGDGVPQNYTEALKWYRLAADQGNAGAQYGIGFMYDYGRGVSKNDTEALKWYRLSADQGYAAAQNLLGDLYKEGGRGVLRNYTEALKWYRLAADQGDAIAENNLGLMYAAGYGVPRNDTVALKWFQLAADQGNVEARENIESTNESMNSEDILELLKRSEEHRRSQSHSSQ